MARTSIRATKTAEAGRNANGSESRSGLTVAAVAPPLPVQAVLEATRAAEKKRPSQEAKHERTQGYGAGYDPRSLNVRVSRLISSKAATRVRSVK